MEWTTERWLWEIGTNVIFYSLFYWLGYRRGKRATWRA